MASTNSRRELFLGRGFRAGGGAGQPLDLQFHQPPGREADHLAQQIAIGALLQQRLQGHHLVGHRRVLGFGV
jgi:hypothetical protein